jgi:hypothetical protein
MNNLQDRIDRVLKNAKQEVFTVLPIPQRHLDGDTPYYYSDDEKELLSKMILNLEHVIFSRRLKRGLKR